MRVLLMMDRDGTISAAVTPARAALLLAAVLLAGCGPGTLSEAELTRARSAVQAGLDAWKKGEPAAKLQGQSPPVQMTDPDWAAGYRLLGYEIKQTDGKAGDHARCRVVLSVQARNGKKSERDVVYEVNGADKIVVARDPFN